jgi:hypothetical protein
MKKIINESSRADITFLVEGKPVHGHRCILLARCRSLEEKIRLIGSRTEEKDKVRWGINHQNHLTMEIQGVKNKSFLALLEYLYTDNIKSLKSNQNDEIFEIDHLLDLFMLSHDFKIEKLRKICEESIEPSMTIENCTVILKKASEIGESADDLKSTCLNYILINYQQVISTSAFYELPKNLIKEINMVVASHGVKVMLGSRSENNTK